MEDGRWEISPRFRMRFMVVVPAPPRRVGFFNPALLCCVLYVTVTKENVGPAAVPVGWKPGIARQRLIVGKKLFVRVEQPIRHRPHPDISHRNHISRLLNLRFPNVAERPITHPQNRTLPPSAPKAIVAIAESVKGIILLGPCNERLARRTNEDLAALAHIGQE